MSNAKRSRMTDNAFPSKERNVHLHDPNGPTKTITLVASDGTSFKVLREVTVHSETIAKMLKDDIGDGENKRVPLCQVKGSVLAKVLEYCTFHVEAEVKDDNGKPRKSDEEIKNFDNEYMRVDESTLYDLILAADYLCIAPLLDLCCRTVAYQMKSKSPEEIRRTFNTM